MTPIQLLNSTSLTAAPPGAPPGVALDLGSFADLLPALLRPVQPRKDDAGAGKDLPATAPTDEEDATAWVVPPVTPVLCPPVPVVAGEGVPAATVVANTSLVTPDAIRPAAFAGQRSEISTRGRDDQEPAPISQAAIAHADVSLGSATSVTGDRTIAYAQAISPTLAPTTPLRPGEGRIAFAQRPTSHPAGSAPQPVAIVSPVHPGEGQGAAAMRAGTVSLAPGVSPDQLSARASTPVTLVSALRPGKELGPGANAAITLELENVAVPAQSLAGAAQPRATVSLLRSGEGPSNGRIMAGQSSDLLRQTSPGSVVSSASVAPAETIVVSDVSRSPAANIATMIAPSSASPAAVTATTSLATGVTTSIAAEQKPAAPSVADAAVERSPSIATPARNAVAVEPAMRATSRIAPAGEVFAAAIRQAVRDERRPVATGAAALVVSASGDLSTQSVQASDATRQPALDMARETWPTKMIERIELLRDAADAADTSIRLLPDRLGAIDVSLRRDGERVEVNLHAHQPETRALIAEAQPKLVEMGEARGLRLSTQADGTGTGAGGQPHQQRAPTPSTPPTQPRRVAAEPADSAEQRIA